MTRTRSIATLLSAIGALAWSHAGQAQSGGPPPPPDAKTGAPIDLAGQWVSVVTEDWRWRMITPPKGDYASVPLNAAGKAAADRWDLAADDAAQQQCRPYGIAGLLRIPGRVRFSWQDANTLKLETDAGQQVRMFNFVAPGTGNILPVLDAPGPGGPRSLQGYTKAQWFKQRQSRGLGFGGAPGPGGALRAITRNMTAGYLRKNGVPYSENAVVTEQYNVYKTDSGTTWLTVTTIVNDPANLSEPFITSTQFKKEADLSRWSPSPCRTDPPLEPPVPGKPRP